jgi:Protein of unknown function (DUF1161)
MFKHSFLGLMLTLACTASDANNCDTLREQIESKIKSAGVGSFTVTVVDAGANAPGKVVGTCDKGAKKILYVQTAKSASPSVSSTSASGPARAATAPMPAASQAKPAPKTAAPLAATPAAPVAAKPPRPPAPPATANNGDAILTECKDGTASVGGSCKN